MGAALQRAGYPVLAQFVALRPPKAANASLLVVAVRYFFHREVVGGDGELFRGLSLERLDQLSRAQEAGFAAVADANERSSSGWTTCSTSSAKSAAASSTSGQSKSGRGGSSTTWPGAFCKR